MPGNKNSYQPRPVTSALSLYKAEVARIPHLTKEEEQALSEQLHSENPKTRDEARNRLVTSHLGLVIKISLESKNYRPNFMLDLIAEGNEALFKATNKFDHKQGRFATYAIPWIQAEMNEFMIRNKNPLKIATTRSYRKLWFNLPSEKARRGLLDNQLPLSAAQEIADNQKVGLKDVIEMHQRMTTHYVPIDGLVDSGSYLLGSTHGTPEEVLSRRAADFRTNITLHIALEKLDVRSRDIIEQRWLQEDEDCATLDVLARKYNISGERVRQIEVVALRKLRSIMTELENKPNNQNGQSTVQTAWKGNAHEATDTKAEASHPKKKRAIVSTSELVHS